jgi:hypothetical protein
MDQQRVGYQITSPEEHNRAVFACDEGLRANAITGKFPSPFSKETLRFGIEVHRHFILRVEPIHLFVNAPMH